MADIKKLRAEYEKAMDAAHKLTAEKDEAVQAVIDKYRDRQREANQKAADLQSDLCDTEVHLALEGRADRDSAVQQIRSTAEAGITANLAARYTRPDGTLDVKAYEAAIKVHRDRAQALGFDHLPFYSAE